MNAFMLEYCSRNDMENTREMLMSAKKPSSFGISDFVARIKQLNRYLDYLPPPLNVRLAVDEITALIRRSVPDWNDSLVRSAQPMPTIQDLTSYYQDLEELEITRGNRNRNQRGDRSGQRERDLVGRRNNSSGRNHHRESHFNEANNNNQEATRTVNNNNNNYNNNNRSDNNN
jgi:hypothetical protein